MTDLSTLNFVELLPSSIAGDPQFKAAAQVLDKQLKAVAECIPAVQIYSRIDELEEPVLSLLAWQFHVDYWKADWPLEVKREAVKSSIKIHKYKGTPWAVKESLRIIGLDDAELIERSTLMKKYYQAGGLRLDGSWRLDGSQRLSNFEKLTGSRYPPHWANFIVRINAAQASRPGIMEEARKAVDMAKPLRSWPLWNIFLSMTGPKPPEAGSKATACAGSVICKPAKLRLDGSWRLGRDASTVRLDGRRLDGKWRLGEVIPGKTTERLQNNRVRTGTSGGIRLEVLPGNPNLRQEPAPRLSSFTLRLDGTWRLGTGLRLDGSWRLDGKTRLSSAPRLGKQAVNSLDGKWRLGPSAPICTTWPSVF
ncbi:phage tail protein I [Maridesulfovibrio sp.]|uniref:phage tail protein I n=1 Tax=Maridesulfovibrio sp. TaxID=2795000 RepID=UPI003B007B32